MNDDEMGGAECHAWSNAQAYTKSDGRDNLESADGMIILKLSLKRKCMKM
jgi:hypothetical protein